MRCVPLRYFLLKIPQVFLGTTDLLDEKKTFLQKIVRYGQH